MRLRIYIVISLLAVAGAEAGAVVGEWKTNPQGQVRLVAPYQTAPADETITFGVQFKPAPGWMVYWKIPGDAGYAPKFEFKGSVGFEKPVIRWPRPQFFILPGNIKEYGYEDEVVYPVTAKRNQDGAIHITAKIDYLTCKDSCIPYRYVLNLDVPAGSGAPDAEIKSLIDRFIQQVPHENDEQVQKSLVPERVAVGADSSLWLILAFAFMGGLILNVMPCVLPVLSIKLFGLLGHGGQERRIVIRDSLASAGGILFSFLVGGGVLALAREAGMAVGWGIQFQDPRFIIFLLIIVLTFALNLYGLFEIHLPRRLSHLGALDADDEGPFSYFISGMFAALLATPCSAPFLGTAMGFAISQPPLIILAIFMAVGFGLAFPYFGLAVFPKTIHILPKPGKWMITLKKLLALLLVGTAIWLGWVLIHQIGVGPKISSYGQVGTVKWIPFNEDELDKLVSQGKPVFVDVTAEWCLTCKVNEKFVIHDPEVAAEFQKRGVVMMLADWTNQDLVIGHYLAKHGRAGIPFYALYVPGRPPLVLSELLTKKKLLNALRSANAI